MSLVSSKETEKKERREAEKKKMERKKRMWRGGNLFFRSSSSLSLLNYCREEISWECTFSSFFLSLSPSPSERIFSCEKKRCGEEEMDIRQVRKRRETHSLIQPLLSALRLSLSLSHLSSFVSTSFLYFFNGHRREGEERRREREKEEKATCFFHHRNCNELSFLSLSLSFSLFDSFPPTWLQVWVLILVTRFPFPLRHLLNFPPLQRSQWTKALFSLFFLFLFSVFFLLFLTLKFCLLFLPRRRKIGNIVFVPNCHFFLWYFFHGPGNCRPLDSLFLSLWIFPRVWEIEERRERRKKDGVVLLNFDLFEILFLQVKFILSLFLLWRDLHIFPSQYFSLLSSFSSFSFPFFHCIFFSLTNYHHLSLSEKVTKWRWNEKKEKRKKRRKERREGEGTGEREEREKEHPVENGCPDIENVFLLFPTHNKKVTFMCNFFLLFLLEEIQERKEGERRSSSFFPFPFWVLFYPSIFLPSSFFSLNFFLDFHDDNHSGLYPSLIPFIFSFFSTSSFYFLFSFINKGKKEKEREN